MAAKIFPRLLKPLQTSFGRERLTKSGPIEVLPFEGFVSLLERREL